MTPTIRTLTRISEVQKCRHDLIIFLYGRSVQKAQDEIEAVKKVLALTCFRVHSVSFQTLFCRFSPACPCAGVNVVQCSVLREDEWEKSIADSVHVVFLVAKDGVDEDDSSGGSGGERDHELVIRVSDNQGTLFRSVQGFLDGFTLDSYDPSHYVFERAEGVECGADESRGKFCELMLEALPAAKKLK